MIYHLNLPRHLFFYTVNHLFLVYFSMLFSLSPVPIDFYYFFCLMIVLVDIC